MREGVNIGHSLGFASACRRLSTSIGELSRRSAGQGVITLTDQGIVSATNFLTGVIIGRACSKEELGLYTLGFSILIIVVNLQDALIATPYVIHCPQISGRELTVYTTNSLVHQFCLSAMAATVLAMAGGLLAAGHGPPGFAPVVLTLAVVIAALTAREYARQLSFARLNIRAAFLLDACVAAIQLGGLVLLVSQGGLSASRAYCVAGAACGVAAVAWLYIQRGQFTLSAGGAVADFRRNWLLGRWNLAGGLANLVNTQAYPWMLTFFHGNAATGSLSACLGVVFCINPVIMGMGNFLRPRITHSLARGGVREVHRMMAKATLAFVSIMTCFSVVMFLFGGRILGMIYGAKYSGLDMPVSVLALSVTADIVSLPLSCSIFVMGRPDAWCKSYFIAMLVTLTLGVWLVKSYGIYGVAFTLLTANTAAAMYRWLVYRRLVERTGTGAAV